MNGNPGTFERATGIDNETLDTFIAVGLKQGFDKAALEAEHARLLSQEVWLSNRYQVMIDRDPPHKFEGMKIWHLSIRRLDRKPIHDWRDLQAIKNQLAGPEYDAIELYPACERVMDAANQYHLWVFVADDMHPERPPRLPLGWMTRNVSDNLSDFPKAKQRGLHQQGATL